MTQITQAQRYTICCLLNQGYKQIEIAVAIGKDKSVISKELKRNSDKRNGVYKHNLVQKK